MSVSRRTLLLAVAAAPVLGILSRPAFAAKPRFYSEKGVAIDGSDAVAYFTQGAPVKGKAEFTYDWMGTSWRFSTAANRDSFAANPERFAPQYGGYCAYAVSEGYTASTIPEAWKIVDGKLYLNYSRRIQRRWEKEIPERIAAANKNWPAVLG